jgi:hypothetical protein
MHDHHVIIPCHLLIIHDICLVHHHAISVPKGVTLLEFKPIPEEQPVEQEVQAPEEAPEGDMVDCPDHTSCNFMKGKPRSIISLLVYESN